MKQETWTSAQEHLPTLAIDVTARSLRVRECVQGKRNRESRSFPGMQPVSLCTQNLYILTPDYVAAVKTDGIRALLTLLPGDNNLYFTMRDMRTYRVRGITKQQLFPGLAAHLLYQLDGELLCELASAPKVLKVSEDVEGAKNPTHFLYVLHDILCYRDQCVEPLTFQARLACLSQLLPPSNDSKRVPVVSKIKNASACTLSVALKSFVPLSELVHLHSWSATPTDGFIFQSLHSAYRRGSCPLLLKWKPDSCNSVDFRVRVQRQVNKPHHFLLQFMCMGEQEAHRLQVHASQEQEQHCLSLHGRIVEFVRKGTSWQAIRFRTDKLEPNAYSTYQRVLQSIQDNISWEQLTHHISSLLSTTTTPGTIIQN